MRSVNLMPGYRVEARRRRGRVQRWVTGCGVYTAALACLWIGCQIIWPDGRTAVASDLAQLERETLADQSAAKALRPRLVQAQAILAAAHSIGDQPDWSYLVALAAEQLGEDAVLRLCRLEPARLDRAQPPGTVDPASIARYRLQLEGYGRTQEAVFGYVRRLEATKLFTSVTLIETRGEAFHDGQAIAFQILCILDDREGGAHEHR